MYCMECGAQIAAEAKFCQKCGTSQTIAEQPAMAKVANVVAPKNGPKTRNWMYAVAGLVVVGIAAGVYVLKHETSPASADNSSLINSPTPLRTTSDREDKKNELSKSNSQVQVNAGTKGQIQLTLVSIAQHGPDCELTWQVKNGKAKEEFGAEGLEGLIVDNAGGRHDEYFLFSPTIVKEGEATTVKGKADTMDCQNIRELTRLYFRSPTVTGENTGNIMGDIVMESLVQNVKINWDVDHANKILDVEKKRMAASEQLENSATYSMIVICTDPVPGAGIAGNMATNLTQYADSNATAFGAAITSSAYRKFCQLSSGLPPAVIIDKIKGSAWGNYDQKHVHLVSNHDGLSYWVVEIDEGQSTGAVGVVMHK